MEAPLEEVTNTNTITNNNTAAATAATANANTVMKGKRTKRQRVQSPIPFALTPNSSSGGEGDSGDGEDCTNNNNIVKNSFTSMIMSPTTSQEFQESTTEEEEDMANCLILLAQGHFNESPKQEDDGIYNPIITTTAINATNSKFNSRKFLETGSTGSGKAGYYVYECKTCNRTFPSFQALGGHRASHKKPRGMNNINDETYNTNNKKTTTQLALSSDEEDAHYKDISSLSLQLSSNSNSNSNNVNTTNNNTSNRGMIYSNQNKAKIHECSICGAEFNSGQALGGHMRRHRAPIGTSSLMSNASSTALSLTPMARNIIESEEEPTNKKGRNLISLDLDLNLPAPDDEKQLPFASKQQQQQQQQQGQQSKPSLVFSSAPALVDCHY